MHCENAPCEVVCPVHATVHDHQGLNAMVYNRCVGTRFCSNNCPYKVRRFNFFGYAQDERTGRPKSWNPEVTRPRTRRHGEMHLLHPAHPRRRRSMPSARTGRCATAKSSPPASRPARPQAIVFGDLNNPDSAVARRKASPLDYVLLEELNTRPRTSYQALIRNPNPAIGGSRTRDDGRDRPARANRRSSCRGSPWPR